MLNSFSNKRHPIFVVALSLIYGSHRGNYRTTYVIPGVFFLPCAPGAGFNCTIKTRKMRTIVFIGRIFNLNGVLMLQI
ncbi:TPA: hypothetical protein ACNBWN_005049, partial [Escherichia coli]